MARGTAIIVLMRSSGWARGVMVLLLALGLWVLTTSVLSRSEAARAGGHAQRARSAGAGAGPVAPAIDAFGLGLMRRLGGANLVFSPDSIAAALAMAGTGAAGQTAVQMAHVLRLSSTRAFVGVGQLQSSILAEQLAAGNGIPEAPTLEIANGLFVQQGLSLLAPFLSGLEAAFGAAPQSVDFRNGGAGALKAINSWVSEHTHGLIPQILASVPSKTLLALADALYLKAAWLHPFKASETASAPFHGLRQVAAMPFMHQTESLHYSRGKGYAAVDLPYLGSTLSLLVVMPAGQSIASLERRLNGELLEQIVHRLATRTVALDLPRFRLEDHLELAGALQALGMTDAFSRAADFSGIAASPPLKLGVVAHAANFSLDEQGTLAAAATVVTVEPTLARSFSGPTVRFDANRPFLFFLRDDRSGAVLFAGRLAEPAAAP
jgi:serpin B